MSNIGKRKIDISSEIQLELKSNLNELLIRGKLGEIKLALSDSVSIDIQGDQLTVHSIDKKIWGTERSRISNAIIGVSQGFQKSLKLVGIGYRVQKKDNALIMKLGFSHDVTYLLPEGIDAICPKQDHIVLFGIEKDFLCKVASEIRALKKPDSYKGKGIRFEDELLILKEGKKK